MRRRLLGPSDKDVAVTLVELARVLKDRGRDAEAEPLVARSARHPPQRLRRRAPRDRDQQERARPVALWSTGDLDGAEPLFRENLATNERLLGAGPCQRRDVKGQPRARAEREGALCRRRALLRESVAIQRKAVGAGASRLRDQLSNLSSAVREQGRLDEAQTLARRSAAHGAAGVRRRPSAPAALHDEPRAATDHAQAAEGGRPSLRMPSIARAAVCIRRRRLAHRAGAQPARRIAARAAALRRGGAAAARRRRKSLKPIPGPQGREATDNRARLALLYSAWHRR